MRGPLRRVLLLGGTGRLGTEVRRAAGRADDVALAAPTRAELDLAVASEDVLVALLRAGLHDAVLNCAAEARVDVCEREPALARRLNATVPGMLARACAAADVPFVHVSTDYVFGGPGGEVGPHPEDAEACPAQAYGRSKADGEAAVLAVAGRRTVARVSWLFAPDAHPFRDFVLAQARSEGVVGVFREQSSRPTYAPALGAWLLDLARLCVDGAFLPDVLHPAGGPGASRGAWARAILDARGLRDVPVVDQPDVPTLAPRPRDSRLAHDRTDAWIDAAWGATLPDWREHAGA